jgi:hypothetical protein
MAEESDVVVGPICEICGKSSNSIYECYIKKERLGKFEMVKAYLCAFHFFEQLEQDTEESIPPPPDDEGPKGIIELPPDEDEDEDEEEEDEDNQSKTKRKCNVDRTGQSFG